MTPGGGGRGQPVTVGGRSVRLPLSPGALAVAVLVALPVLTFSVPALAGHPFMASDDLIQNYPLRVLVARNLDNGHLPLWNPYIWSGTALLGGLNAGAFYPGTLLFTVLPSLAAWVINQILVYVVGGVGLYVFLRRCRLSVASALLGSLTFTVGGFMSSQLGHIDLVQGASLVPWMLVAIHRIALPPPLRHGWRRWGPLALLSAAFTLLLLTGSPEAAIYDSILAGIYGLWMAGQHRAPRVIVQMALAGGVALVLAAVQWLPGLVFASHSQRSGSSYSFFILGSLSPKLTALTVMPYLLGSYGRFGLPIYHGQYNLGEVSTYVGILPVCACLAMLAPSWRKRRKETGLVVWYVVVVVGLLLSFGGYTPLAHLLVHIPVYGQQRLQSRNMLAVDLGLSILFAYWIDGVRQRVAGPGPAGITRAERVWTLLPVACVVALVVALVASPVVISQELGSPLPLGSFRRLEGYLAVGLVVAGAGGLAAAYYDRIPRGRLVRVLAVIVVVDLGIYEANQYWLTPPPTGNVTDTTALAAAVASHTGPSGRFAIYDPNQIDPAALNALGQPDLNVLRSLGSVQGYGSVVSGDYDQATGAHQQSDLSVPALANTTFDYLNLTALVTRPAYFITPVGQSPTSPAPPGTPAVPVAIPPLTVAAGGQQYWYLGKVLRLGSADLALQAQAGCPLPAGALSVGAMTPSGGTTWAPGSPTTSADGVSSALGGASAIGVVVRNTSTCQVSVRSVTVNTAGGSFVLDGALQGSVQPPRWQFAGTLGEGFSVFRNTSARGSFWVASSTGQPVPASLRVIDDPVSGNQTVEVSTAVPAVVARSVVTAPGWSAVVRTGRPPGQGRRTAVVAVGSVPGAQVQGVKVPAGTSTVTWDYRPASVAVGGALSLGGLAALVALVLGWGLRELIRRSGGRGRQLAADQPGDASDDAGERTRGAD